MWKLARFLLAASLCGLLAACGGGGGGDASTEPELAAEEITLPPVPAQAGSGDIGAAGGTVEAVLEGGTQVRLNVDAGTVPASNAVRIDPLPRENTSQVGRFKLVFAGALPERPVTLELTLDERVQPGTPVRATMTIGGVTLPVSAPFDSARRVVVTLPNVASLVELQARPLAAGRGRDAPAASGSGRERIAQDASLSELAVNIDGMEQGLVAAALTSAVRAVGPTLDTNEAILLAMVFDAAAGTMASDDPLLNNLARSWRDLLCPEAQFAVNSLESYNGDSIPTFSDRMASATLWAFAANELARIVEPLRPLITRCEGLPSDPTEPARLKLADFRTRQAELLDQLQLTLDSDWGLLADTRIPELLNLESRIQTLGINASMLALIENQAHRLRLSAWDECRDLRQRQTKQLRLVRRMLEDVTFASAAGFDVQTIADEAQTCGLTPILTRTTDGQGVPLDVDLLLMGNPQRGGPAPSRRGSVNVGRAVFIEFFGPMQALMCPPPTPQLQEQLVWEAGPPGGPFQEVARLLSDGQHRYLENQPQSFLASALRTFGNQDARITMLRIRREGNPCAGAFPGVQAGEVLVEIELNFNAITILTDRLDKGRLEIPYELALRAEGSREPYVWTATGLPDGLKLDAATGVIQGTPARVGTTQVVIRVEGNDGARTERSLPLEIGLPPDRTYTGEATFLDSRRGITERVRAGLRLERRGTNLWVLVDGVLTGFFPSIPGYNRSNFADDLGLTADGDGALQPYGFVRGYGEFRTVTPHNTPAQTIVARGRISPTDIDLYLKYQRYDIADDRLTEEVEYTFKGTLLTANE